MTAHWSAIINFIRKYVYPARIIAILLMAGATLPQVADAITVDLNYDKNNVAVITPVWSQEWSVANVLGDGYVVQTGMKMRGRVKKHIWYGGMLLELIQKFVCVSENKSAMLKSRSYCSAVFVMPVILVSST